MRYPLRRLFLITTVVAIIAYTFTLGVGEATVALVFFAPLASRSKKKSRWTSSVLLVFLLVALGVLSRRQLRYDLGKTYSPDNACVDLYFTGSAHNHIREVYDLLSADLAYDRTSVSWSSMPSTVPFFRTGYIKGSIASEDIADNLSEVRRKVRVAFPNLDVTISGSTEEE